MTDDRDFSWLGPRTQDPGPAPAVDHFLWALEKAAHRTECRVRATPLGPELRISVDGELWWSHVVRGGAELLEDTTERQRARFEAKGWTRPGPQP